MAAPNPQPHPAEKVDPVLYLLFVGMIFFTVILIGVEHYFASDGQVFQVIAGVLTGFTGAFFGRLKPQQTNPAGGNDNSVNVNTKPVAIPVENPEHPQV